MSAATEPLIGAVLSIDRRYRYQLWRRWGASERSLCFVMLNPSTADAVTDDHTIRKCIGFAKRFGYDGIDIVNLYAFRATLVDALFAEPSPVGCDNDGYLIGVTDRVMNGRGAVVCAWGADPRAADRAREVCDLLEERGIRLHTLHTNNDGTPTHPARLPYSHAALKEWRP